MLFNVLRRYRKIATPTNLKNQVRINERIRVPQIRVIDETGNMLGVMSPYEALKIARERGYDLIEVSPTASPPVCKIGDYGKFLYEKKKKDHEAKKKQAVINVKEIQLRPQTEEHDLEYKFKNLQRFLEEGDKAKISVMFRGREVVYIESGKKLLNEWIEKIKDLGVVEAPPKLEGKRLSMIIAPAQGAGKKPKPAIATSAKAEPKAKVVEKAEK